MKGKKTWEVSQVIGMTFVNSKEDFIQTVATLEEEEKVVQI